MRRCLAAAAVFVVSLLLAQTAASAMWADGAAASASYSSGSLTAPTNPSVARGLCVLVVGDELVVSWTATTSTWADGYEIARSTNSGGPYTVVGTVAGAATATFTNAALSFSTDYYYVVRATKGAWRSPDTAAVTLRTRSSLCLPL